MSTTRHLIKRQRRLATAARTAATPSTPPTSTPEPPQKQLKPSKSKPDGDKPDGEAKPTAKPRVRIPLPALLCVLTVLLGGFAAFAVGQASDLRDQPAARNSALTDMARTSEVKGQITKAVESIFSYNFADPGALDKAAKAQLTGKAVTQHTEMLAAVRAQGQKQKLVLTTTVTESGVELIDGDRARVLVFADQSNTRTATKEETTYGAAMFAVDTVRSDGAWRIASIDTFGAGS
jgi:Mce-associated membrane protein